MSARIEATVQDLTEADATRFREVLEYYWESEWTDGLPVVPTTDAYTEEFLAQVPEEADAELFTIPHLERTMTVRLAAVNAALAGCRPEYFPVVVAAWRSIAAEPHPRRGIWQSTTGTAPLLVVNGPVRSEIGLNSSGNIFGSGFRANAVIGRAIRLGCINVFDLHPHKLDQATQGTPAKYAACLAENEEESPWDPWHVDQGMSATDSSVAAYVIRSIMHIEARQTMTREQLALDITDTICRTGALIHEYTSALLVLSPEHARLFADNGWSKDRVRDFIFQAATRDRATLEAVGKDAVSRETHWRLGSAHPDAIPDRAAASEDPRHVPLLSHPTSVQIIVGGANNAGVSAVVEIFTLNPPRELPFSVQRVGDDR